MKQKSFLTKILAVLLVAAFFTACPAHIVALATGNSQSDEYAGMTAEEKQASKKSRNLIQSFLLSVRNQRKPRNISMRLMKKFLI